MSKPMHFELPEELQEDPPPTWPRRVNRWLLIIAAALAAWVIVGTAWLGVAHG